jgi:hypothetical protein
MDYANVQRDCIIVVHPAVWKRAARLNAHSDMTDDLGSARGFLTAMVLGSVLWTGLFTLWMVL